MSFLQVFVNWVKDPFAPSLIESLKKERDVQFKKVHYSRFKLNLSSWLKVYITSVCLLGIVSFLCISSVKAQDFKKINSVNELSISSSSSNVNPSLEKLQIKKLQRETNWIFYSIKFLEILFIPGTLWVISVIYQTSERRNKVRIDYLNKLGSIYRQVKSVRRLLRAGGINEKLCDSPADFNEEKRRLYKNKMESLNQAQLELEALKIEGKHLPELKDFSLENSLKNMEKYLNGIIKEYEARPFAEYEECSTSPHRNSKDTLKKLKEFVRPKTENSPINTHFFNEYDSVIELISQCIKTTPMRLLWIFRRKGFFAQPLEKGE